MLALRPNERRSIERRSLKLCQTLTISNVSFFKDDGNNDIANEEYEVSDPKVEYYSPKDEDEEELNYEPKSPSPPPPSLPATSSSAHHSS